MKKKLYICPDNECTTPCVHLIPHELKPDCLNAHIYYNEYCPNCVEIIDDDNA